MIPADLQESNLRPAPSIRAKPTPSVDLRKLALVLVVLTGVGLFFGSIWDVSSA
jgi:hypothetical protein